MFIEIIIEKINASQILEFIQRVSATALSSVSKHTLYHSKISNNFELQSSINHLKIVEYYVFHLILLPKRSKTPVNGEAAAQTFSSEN